MTDKEKSWKWQLANRITTADELARLIKLSPSEKADIEQSLSLFRMAITPYYASLMDKEDPNCPIRMQMIPSAAERVRGEFDLDDPLGEIKYNPAPNVVRRYPDRALLLVTMQCASYCRHCTRRRVVGSTDCTISKEQLKQALDYIERNPEIRDVLISGGDPFILETGALEDILAAVRAIKHVEIIRIGTRVPVVLPMRIDKELTDMLKKYHPVWVNTHFNHPKELTPEAIAACEALVDAGIPVGNQTVLLKGINDDAEILKKLFLGLVKARVRPYYLFQCDLSVGISHFRTPVEKGIEIMHSLTSSISGYAVPKYAIDLPVGGGKVTLGYNYVVSKEDKELVLENYLGKLYRYPVR
ncbi:MAG: KamA family radical SAM protein [Spirochaetales bacterium]|nr:KamA family radical SAM protein [Spirochaetales bacterium]